MTRRTAPPPLPHSSLAWLSILASASATSERAAWAHGSNFLAFVQVREEALLGGLVVPEAVEAAAVADAAGGGVVIADLDHQLGAEGDPLEVAAAGPAARLGGAALARLQWF